MNLVGEKVQHRQFGTGVVVDQTCTDKSNSFVVRFESEDRTFLYSKSLFTTFMKAEDPKTQDAILEEYRLAEEEKRRIAEENARREAEEKARLEAERLAEEERKKTEKRPQKGEKEYIKRERVSGKRMTFFVFQGSTFDRESRGGYIWAPVANSAGQHCHHWDRLMDIRPGDIIFHGSDAFVKAISMAQGECYDCHQPEELRSEDMWEPEGRRVDCEYVLVDKPIKTALVRDEILRYCNVKYAPFDRDGNGNMGYLYELNPKLARSFLRETIKNNPQIGDIDYVQELLSEGDND